MEEVLRRQNRTHFDRSNVNAVVCNSLFLLASFLVSALVNSMSVYFLTTPSILVLTYTAI